MQATSPTDPRVLDAMLPYMTQRYGNPHSKTHAYGWETETAVEEGRKVSLDCVELEPKELLTNRDPILFFSSSLLFSMLPISLELTLRISYSLQVLPNLTICQSRVSLGSLRERRSICKYSYFFSFYRNIRTD